MSENKQPDYEQFLRRLDALEQSLKYSDTSSEELQKVVEQLRVVIQEMQKDIGDLDKNLTREVEKRKHIYYRLEELQKAIDGIEGQNSSRSDKHRDLLENAVMLVIGGLISYFFATLKN